MQVLEIPSSIDVDSNSARPPEPTAQALGSVLRGAALVFLALSLITGVAYPLVVTGVAQVVFPSKADGSLIYQGGRLVGSNLIGQAFTDPGYFWSRPSATMPFPYNAALGAASNLGPTNPLLREQVDARVRALRASDPSNTAPVPADLATSSASGLDPDVSPAGADWQVARVARARGVSQAAVRRLVQEHTTGRSLGFLGQPRVNVLELNLALDQVARR